MTSTMKKTGACEEDLWEFGFRGIRTYDPEEDENYYKLFLDGEEVGWTEINEANGDLEIVCNTKVKYDKVIKVVGKAIYVWKNYIVGKQGSLRYKLIHLLKQHCLHLSQNHTLDNLCFHLFYNLVIQHLLLL